MTSNFGKVIVTLDNNCNGHPINNGSKEVFLREDNKKLTSSVLCSICWRHCLGALCDHQQCDVISANEQRTGQRKPKIYLPSPL